MLSRRHTGPYDAPMSLLSTASGLLGALAAVGTAAEEPSVASLDRLFVKQESPVPVVRETGSLRLSLFHRYPMALHHVRLAAASNEFTMKCEPREYVEIKPTTIVTFTLHLRRTASVSKDQVKLPVQLTATEISGARPFDIEVPLTLEGAQKVNDEMAIHVGEVEVRVRRYGNAAYVAQVIAMVLLLGLLAWRKKRAG